MSADERRLTGRTRRSLRSRRVLAAGAGVGALAMVLAACGSSGTTTSSGGSKASTTGLYGSLPASGTVSKGGTITIGQLKGSTPEYAMPITPAAVASVYGSYDFIDLMNQPLYWSPTGSTPAVDQSLSLADLPTYSGGNKTVTIKIKPGWKWSDGTPVTAQDVVFYIDVLRQAVKESPANFSNYTPGFFPDNVSSATASGQTLTLKLTKAYNPGYYTDDQLDLLYAFPLSWAVDSSGGTKVDYTVPANAKKIYDYLNKQASTLATFGTNPLWKESDGPMKLESFNATTGDYSMGANPDYGGPQKPQYTTMSVETFTSTQAEFNQLLDGTLDIGGVDYSNLPQVNTLKAKGYSVFGLPDFGFEAAFLNFKDKTGDFDKIIGQLYIRQALAHLIDQPGYVKGIFKGAGGADYGPIPAVPSSPFIPSNATNTPYPYSVSTAAKLLSSHGWKVVANGTTTCQKAGSAANECGAGIPAGTPLSFNWQYGNSPPAIEQQSVALASAAKQVGINVRLQKQTFNYLITNDTDPSAPSKENDWAVSDFGGFTQSLYPTTNTLFNTGGSFNLGGYNDTKANNLINASVYGANPAAVKAEASYLTEDIPVLFQPSPDLIWAVKKTIGAGQTDAWTNMTQYTWTPQYWYLKKS
jgi:peptide/nickel transport system substrate-binding protein